MGKINKRIVEHKITDYVDLTKNREMPNAKKVSKMRSIKNWFKRNIDFILKQDNFQIAAHAAMAIIYTGAYKLLKAYEFIEYHINKCKPKDVKTIVLIENQVTDSNILVIEKIIKALYKQNQNDTDLDLTLNKLYDTINLYADIITQINGKKNSILILSEYKKRLTNDHRNVKKQLIKYHPDHNPNGTETTHLLLKILEHIHNLIDNIDNLLKDINHM